MPPTVDSEPTPPHPVQPRGMEQSIRQRLLLRPSLAGNNSSGATTRRRRRTDYDKMEERLIWAWAVKYGGNWGGLVRFDRKNHHWLGGRSQGTLRSKARTLRLKKLLRLRPEDRNHYTPPGKLADIPLDETERDKLAAHGWTDAQIARVDEPPEQPRPRRATQPNGGSLFSQDATRRDMTYTDYMELYRQDQEMFDSDDDDDDILPNRTTGDHRRAQNDGSMARNNTPRAQSGASLEDRNPAGATASSRAPTTRATRSSDSVSESQSGMTAAEHGAIAVQKVVKRKRGRPPKAQKSIEAGEAAGPATRRRIAPSTKGRIADGGGASRAVKPPGRRLGPTYEVEESDVEEDGNTSDEVFEFATTKSVTPADIKRRNRGQKTYSKGGRR